MDLQVRPVDQLKDTVDLAHSEQSNKKGDKAVDYWIKAKALARIVHGGNHWFYAFCCIKTGQCYLELLRLPEQSLQHIQEGKEILESLSSTLGDDSNCLHSLSLATCILGQILTLNGRLTDAEKCLSKSENYFTRYRLSCQDDPDLDMKITTSLGRLCTKQKNFDLAEGYFEKALDLYKILPVKDFHDETLLLMDFAEVKYLQGNYDLSISRLQEAEKLASECFGQVSEEKADVMNKLAKVYFTMYGLETNDVDDTAVKLEDTLWGAYNIYVLVKSSSHHKAILVQEELVKLLVMQSRFEEAIKHLKELIVNQSVLYGEGSVKVSRTRKTLASVYLQVGHIEKGSEQLKLAQEVFMAVYGPNNSETTEISTTLKALTGSIEGKKTISKKPPFKCAF
ncbi:PREDICTED: uncharacterized protein LOC100633120 [Amphimedon queenslandica]|uniref:MalT-like TPR region domain-containing protein n=1 Tax=Amphimedon queenslandica TaxID=400682 RepID=A0AAN0IV44_AMPQE|nr:PREDICTED: uncharacterized protein LOC100633120 [Amphimedon queenslandica]|eukprot:XP_019848695.1 PREDICTED: uncharacterized protein LOC100633120 [Amphimedon queenslandica]